MYSNFIEPLEKTVRKLLLTCRASFLLVVPCLVTTAPPLILAPFTPFPPLSPHYTIYNGDINNHCLLYLGQLCTHYSIHTYIHVTRSQPDLSRLVIDPDQMEEEGQLDHTHLQENEEDYQVQTIVRDQRKKTKVVF
jgi:hypothetical protein